MTGNYTYGQELKNNFQKYSAKSNFLKRVFQAAASPSSSLPPSGKKPVVKSPANDRSLFNTQSSASKDVEQEAPNAEKNDDRCEEEASSQADAHPPQFSHFDTPIEKTIVEQKPPADTSENLSVPIKPGAKPNVSDVVETEDGIVETKNDVDSSLPDVDMMPVESSKQSKDDDIESSVGLKQGHDDPISTQENESADDHDSQRSLDDTRSRRSFPCCLDGAVEWGCTQEARIETSSFASGPNWCNADNIN